jgi:hypothetical protein
MSSKSGARAKRKGGEGRGGSSGPKKFKFPPVGPGLRGILVTCGTGRMRDSEREVLQLLNEVADHLYGPTQAAPVPAADDAPATGINVFTLPS